MRTYSKHCSAFTSLLAIILSSTTCLDAGLAHRWSFNGDLNDQIGGQTASILSAEESIEVEGKIITGGKAKLGNESVTLKGGNHLTAEYVELGSDVLGEAKQVTIELWATPHKPLPWARIFNVTGDSGVVDAATDTLFMTWNRSGAIDKDRVELSLAKYQGVKFSNETNAPYELEQEYHIVITLDSTVPGETKVTWYTAPSNAEDLGPAKGHFVCKIDLDDFSDNYANLGRSTWNNPIANASYNEVRVYHSVLDIAQLESSHDAGADDITMDIPEPATFALFCGVLCFAATVLVRRRHFT